MHLIQSVLSQAVSGAHRKNFSVVFGQFLASVGTFGVKTPFNFDGISTMVSKYSTSIGG